MTNPLIIIGVLIATSSSVFAIGHNFFITQYDCNKIKDQILLQDCINASLPITPIQIFAVLGVSALLISIGMYKDKWKSNMQPFRHGVEQ